MIPKIVKPTLMYRVCRINLNKHKKVKKFAKTMEYGAMSTLATLQAGYLLRQPVIEQFIKTAPKSDIVVTHLPKGANMGPIPYAAPNINNFKDSLFKIKTDFVKPLYTYVIPQVSSNEKALQKKILLKIIEEDKNIPTNLNTDKMASTILNIANELGADPITVACIIKRESNFQTGLDGNGAKGLMQITKITVKDMYQKGRDRLYHAALNDLKKDHPSFIYLFNELQNKDSINIKVGTISYLMRLQEAGGNVKNALRNYNGSNDKDNYARDVLNNIQKYTAEYQKLKKSTIKPA